MRNMRAWLARATYGWLWIDPDRERRAITVAADYWHPVAVSERALEAKITAWLANRTPRERTVHVFSHDRRCVRCGVTELVNAAVRYGYGVPCLHGR